MINLQRSKRVMSKLIAGLLACVLCVSCVPSYAWAQPEERASFTPSVQADNAEKAQVVLTVMAGTQTDWTTNETTYVTWVNKYYTLDDVLAAAHASGRTDRTLDTLTMQDLLDAAVQAGDLSGYEALPSSFGGSYLVSITSKQDETYAGVDSPNYDLSQFWSVLEDGVQTPLAFDLVTLKANHAYQFAWDTYTSAICPDNWAAFYADNPAQALQASADASQGQVTLTIVAGSQTDYATGKVTYPTWVNKRYGLADVLSDAQAKDPTKTLATLTMQDLLAYAQTTKDIDSYEATNSSYGGLYLNALTSKDGVTLAGWNSADYSASLYWSIFNDGAYADTSFSEIKLQDQKSYQFAWNSLSSAAVPRSWNEFYALHAPGAADDKTSGNEGEGNQPTITPTPPTETLSPDAIDQACVDTLIATIVSTYAKTQDAWQVMDMAALGRTEDVDVLGFVNSAALAMKEPAADNAMTAYQRTILALTAVGEDAAKVPDGQGVFNAVDEMAQRVTASSPVTVQAFTLLAYASGPYEVPTTAALTQDELIAALLKNQLPDGGFSYRGASADADVTAMVIAALAPYQKTSAPAAKALGRAIDALHGLQHEDGGFGATGFGVDPATNANSTAMAVIALCAVGIDPATDWVTKSGATPLSALLGQASAQNDGFVYAGQLNPGATEQGFRALVAYRGFKNTGLPYNIYTQARLGQAAIPDDSFIDGEGGDKTPQITPEYKTETSPSSDTQKGSESADQKLVAASMPATGDHTVSAGVALLAMCALGATCVAALRLRKLRLADTFKMHD